MPTPVRRAAPAARRTRRPHPGAERPRAFVATAAALAAALMLAGCAGTPLRHGPASMQAPLNASTGCYAAAPNLHAAYNRSYTVLGHSYAPLPSASGYDVEGTASWYGWESGKRTSMGSAFDPRAFTAASRVLPLPTCVEVTNLRNGRSALVLVNDRGPFVDSRIMDLSYGAAKALGVTATGTAPVHIVALASGVVQNTSQPPAAAPAPAAAVAAPAPPEAAAPLPTPASQPARTEVQPASAPENQPLAPVDTAPDATPASAPARAASDPLGAWIAANTAAAAPPVHGGLSTPAARMPTPAAASEAAATDDAGAMPAAALAPKPAGAAQTYVQTGAFTLESHARREAERLRHSGIGEVEVVPGFAQGRTWYKVQIGPLPSGTDDPSLLRQLAQLGLHGYSFVQQ